MMKTQRNTHLKDSVTDDQPHQLQPRVNMLIPPPVLLLMLAAAAAYLHWVRWRSFQLTPERTLIGSVVVLLGCLLIYLCGKSFLKEKTPIRPDRTHATSIVIHGPYAYSRNPMYVGMALMLVGLSIVLKSPAFLFSAFIFMVILHFGVVLREERYLLQIQPDTYGAYMQKVRRWL